VKTATTNKEVVPPTHTTQKQTQKEKTGISKYTQKTLIRCRFVS